MGLDLNSTQLAGVRRHAYSQTDKSYAYAQQQYKRPRQLTPQSACNLLAAPAGQTHAKPSLVL